MRLIRRQNRSERTLTPGEELFIAFRGFAWRLWVVCNTLTFGVCLVAGDLGQWVASAVMMGVEALIAVAIVWWLHCR